MIFNIKIHRKETVRNWSFDKKTMLFHWNIGIRCFNFFVTNLFWWRFGCVPTARTWVTPHFDKKCRYLAADCTNFLKAPCVFYGKSENFSPSRFSSNSDFLLREAIWPNGNPPNLKYIWWKSSTKLSEKFINFWFFSLFYYWYIGLLLIWNAVIL